MKKKKVKVTQDEFRKSQKLVDSVFHTADIGIAIIDSKGKFVRTNDGCSKLLGYKRDELTGKSYFNFILPNQRKKVKADHRKYLTGKTENQERKMLGKTGHPIEVYITNTLYVDEEGSKYLVKTFRDISESNKYKDLLLKAERATHVGGFEADLITGITTWTDEMYNIYELEKKSKPSFKVLKKHFSKEAIPEVEKLIRRAITTGKSLKIEHEIITAKKNRKWVRTTLTPYRVKSKTIKLFGTLQDITEQKKAEIELGNYKDLLQEAQKSAQIGGYELDVLSNKLIWTDELSRIYEVGKNFIPTVDNAIAFYDKETRPLLHKAVRDALKYGKNFDIEYEILSGMKNRKWVRSTGNVKKRDSKVVKLIGSVQDITEKKTAELEIERLSWVARHTNNGVVLTDKETRIEWVNESFEKILGYTLAEVKGLLPRELLHGPETDLTIAKRIRSSLQNHLPASEVFINYTKDRKPIWIKVDIAPIFKDKKLVNYIGIIADLTDLVKANEMQKTQESLMQSKNLLEAISKDFPNGMIGILDRNFKCTFIGGSELKKLGHKGEDFIGDKIFNLISPAADAFAEPFLNKAFLGNRVTFEVKVKDRVYLVNAVPLKNDDEAISQVLVVLRNITKRKTMEEEILRALHKQQELNELKSKFVSVASHEFRTPLSTILSSNFLIAQYNKPEDEEKRVKHINRINASVANLTDLINEFLSLDRIEAGKVANNPSLFNITYCCADVIEEMQAGLKKGQTIITNYNGRHRDVFLDRKHVRDVLINLISNASKYSPEGNPIHIDYGFEKGKLNIAVRDKGIGIPEKDQKHLFEKFFRANNVTAIQGTGMGLHIVKRYMDIMGGEITFKSKENEGSTFALHFPQADIPGYQAV